MKDPKRRKKKNLGDFSGEWNGSQIQEKAKNKLISTDVEEITTSENLPKMKKSSPKEDPVSVQEKAGNGVISKKNRKFSFKELLLSSGPENLLAAKAAATRKRKSFQNFPGILKWTVPPLWHYPAHLLYLNKNKIQKKKTKNAQPLVNRHVVFIYCF